MPDYPARPLAARRRASRARPGEPLRPPSPPVAPFSMRIQGLRSVSPRRSPEGPQSNFLSFFLSLHRAAIASPGRETLERPPTGRERSWKGSAPGVSVTIAPWIWPIVKFPGEARRFPPDAHTAVPGTPRNGSKRAIGRAARWGGDDYGAPGGAVKSPGAGPPADTWQSRRSRSVEQNGRRDDRISLTHKPGHLTNASRPPSAVRRPPSAVRRPPSAVHTPGGFRASGARAEARRHSKFSSSPAVSQRKR